MQRKLKKEKGSSTLEILLAFAILSICMAAIILVIFGNQSVAIDTQTNTEALYKAQTSLENARALSRQNFLSVVSTTTTSTSTITYTNVFSVNDITQCEKQATSTITWMTGSRIQKVELATILVSTSTVFALGGDCAFGPGPTNWHNPLELTYTPRGGLGNVDANDVDIENGILYIASGGNSLGKPDLIIEDASSLTATPPGGTLVDGDMQDEGVNHYSAIDVAKNNATGKYYAYLYIGNDANTKQLHVIDVSNINTLPTKPNASSSLPGVTSSTNGGGAIYFYKDKVYVGVGFTTGNEFHVFDVSNPLVPVWNGSYPTAHNVYRVVVRDQIVGGTTKTLAYVALSTNNPAEPELAIYDVTNPATITQIGSFNPPGNEYGTSLYVLGNKAYLGRVHGADPNFYVVDITNPVLPTSCTNCHFTITSEDLNDLVISNNFAFIITDSALHILDVSDPSNIKKPTGSPNGIYTNDFTSVDLDSSKNLIYLTSLNQGNKVFHVFYPGP